jgi:hypothetical protein
VPLACYLFVAAFALSAAWEAATNQARRTASAIG